MEDATLLFSILNTVLQDKINMHVSYIYVHKQLEVFVRKKIHFLLNIDVSIIGIKQEIQTKITLYLLFKKCAKDSLNKKCLS